MTDELNGVPNAAAKDVEEDQVKNLKAEFARKRDADMAAFDKKLADSQNAIVEQIKNLNVQNAIPKKSVVDDDDLLYDNPKEFKKRLTAEVTEEVLSKVDTLKGQDSEIQQKQRAAYQEVAASFPEINKIESDLSVKANSLFNALSEEERQNPYAIKSTVYQAAMEIGLDPVSKRKTSDDPGFVLTNKKPNEGAPQEDGDGLDPITKLIAESLNKPVNDPKYVKKIKQIQKRTNYKDWVKVR